ncbi:MAG: carboxypeptidase-like regulatory domain-containing protein [Bacteroidia bacterium]
MKTITGLFLLFFLSFNGLKAQTVTTKSDNRTLIQFSGVVLDQDSLTPIPFVSILIKGTGRGTICNFQGFFSLIVNAGDELEFHSVSHKFRSYKIADTLTQKYYYAIQILTKDTIQLTEVDVYPWPSKEDFKRAFLALDLSDTDMDRANKNLEKEALTYLERNQSASASENYKYVMQAYYTKVYTTGQAPSMTLLNPVAWAQFIDAWRKGKFSNKKKKN